MPQPGTYTGRSKQHAAFEKHALNWLARKGFLPAKAPIQAHVHDDFTRILRCRNSPTALWVRNVPDWYLQHATVPTEFYLELKTRTEPEEPYDLLLEAVQLAFNLYRSHVGVETLYAYWNPFNNRYAGFWVTQLPPLRAIMIPGRWTGPTLEWMQDLFSLIFPSVNVVHTASTQGSGTPFAIVDASNVSTLPHWCSLVRDLLPPTE